jgi:hypothetical protein
MKTLRGKARMAGILYIIGTVAGIMSFVCTGAIRSAKDPLAAIAGHEYQIVLGALCVLLMGLALVMVPVVLFPVLKKQNEVLALGYVVMRSVLEGITYLAITIGWLFLPVISKAYLTAGPAWSFDYKGLGNLLLESAEISHVGTIVFCIGACMFYSLLYRSRLVPRFLSVWGLLAVVPYIAASILAMFGVIAPQSTAATLMAMPLALQEMVLAVWLIAKGFDARAVTALSNKSNPGGILESGIAEGDAK